MSDESSKINFEGVQKKRKLEVEANDESSSNAITYITITPQQQTGSGTSGAEAAVGGDSPRTEGSYQSTDRDGKNSFLTALAKVKADEEIDSTWRHFHKMWAEMGHDAETVETLEKEIIDTIKGAIKTKKDETVRQRYYNGNGVRIHPLLVDNILDRIFVHVVGNSSDHSARSADVSANIRNCRLVCKTWNERATDIVLKTGSQIILGETRSREILLKKPTYIKGFVEAFKGSTVIPFQKYSISGIIFEPAYDVLLKELLCVIGSSATDITISFDWNQYQKRCWDKCWSENLKFLKLKKFVLVLYSSTVVLNDPAESRESTAAVQFADLIFTSAPHLHEVYFRLSERKSRWTDRNQQQILNIIPVNVKVLKLDVPFLSDLHFQALAAANLELNELTLECWEVNCSDKSIREFFGKQSNSLEYFNLCCNELSSKVLFSDSPRMGKLTRLDVIIQPDTTINFSFAHKFPTLKKLRIKFSIKNDFRPDFKNLLEETRRAPLVSLEDLTLDWLDNTAFFSTADHYIRMAKECFPNVKILNVSLGPYDSKIKSVFEHFNHIEELTINLRFMDPRVKNGDALLTGIPEDVCNNAVLKQGKFRDVDIQTFQNKYSLLNLTKLKKLHISNAMSRATVVFSDFCAHHILLKLPNLEELHIEKSRMSNECKELLRSKLKKCTLGD